MIIKGYAEKKFSKSPFYRPTAKVGLIIVYIFLLCFIGNIVRLLVNLKEHTRKKKIIIIAEIEAPIVLIALFIIFCLIPIELKLHGPYYKSYMYGFRDQIKSKANIESIRDWLRTLREEDYTGENFIALQSKFPESLKVLRPKGVSISTDKNGNAAARLMWGSSFAGAWGMVIGMEDLEIPPSEFGQLGEYLLPLEPGVYVWYALDY